MTGLEATIAALNAELGQVEDEIRRLRALHETPIRRLERAVQERDRLRRHRSSVTKEEVAAC